MNVIELIGELQNMDPMLEVVIRVYDDMGSEDVPVDSVRLDPREGQGTMRIVKGRFLDLLLSSVPGHVPLEPLITETTPLPPVVRLN